MAIKVTDQKRKAFESKIEGSDKVEIKITVTGDDEERAYEALDIQNRDVTQREIYFFDTPELTLYKAGVILRARAIEDADHDSVVKVRPVDPGKVDDKWKVNDGFKVEADAVGDKVVMSASFKVKQKKGAIKKVANGELDISELFSKKQKAFAADFYGGPVERDDLIIMGPIQTLRADIKRPGMAYGITAEHWTLPDDSHLLEVSIKCLPAEAVVAREVFEAFLAGHGLDPYGAQATKTKLVLTGWLGR
jgi:hypothetical protein